jgi:hypothetical protein
MGVLLSLKLDNSSISVIEALVQKADSSADNV